MFLSAHEFVRRALRRRSPLVAFLAGVIALAPIIMLDSEGQAQTNASGSAASPSPPSPPTPEQQRQAEERAAEQAAMQAKIVGPRDVSLGDQGSFVVPKEFYFIPKPEGMRLMRAWGNVIDPNVFLGLAFSSRKEDRWTAEISFVKEGYVKDDDAKNWNADDLLAKLKEGTQSANDDRIARGFPELEVLGWVERPAYDATTHRLVWSLSLREKNASGSEPRTVNYNTYLLGRDGYFTLNFITGADRIEAEKETARTLLSNLSFAPGKRYEDFNSSTDKIAAYGIAALVGGLVAKKLGLLALAALFVVKFVKVIALGAAAVTAGIAKWFRRRPSSGGGTQA
jgi:uncharacterized membrane-anchored protein